MSTNVDNGIARQCKNNQGGLQEVYVFPFTQLSRSQVEVTNQSITDFPDTDIVKYEIFGASFNENSKIAQGGVEWSQTVSFKAHRLAETSELYKLTLKDYCVLIRDRNGLYRIIGVWNGATANVTSTSGADKSSFQGYNVSFQAKEDNQAYFISATKFNEFFTIL